MIRPRVVGRGDPGVADLDLESRRAVVGEQGQQAVVAVLGDSPPVIDAVRVRRVAEDPEQHASDQRSGGGEPVGGEPKPDGHQRQHPLAERLHRRHPLGRPAVNSSGLGRPDVRPVQRAAGQAGARDRSSSPPSDRERPTSARRRAGTSRATPIRRGRGRRVASQPVPDRRNRWPSPAPRCAGRRRRRGCESRRSRTAGRRDRSRWVHPTRRCR